MRITYDRRNGGPRFGAAQDFYCQGDPPERARDLTAASRRHWRCRRSITRSPVTKSKSICSNRAHRETWGILNGKDPTCAASVWWWLSREPVSSRRSQAAACGRPSPNACWSAFNAVNLASILSLIHAPGSSAILLRQMPLQRAAGPRIAANTAKPCSKALGNVYGF